MSKIKIPAKKKINQEDLRKALQVQNVNELWDYFDHEIDPDCKAEARIDELGNVWVRVFVQVKSTYGCPEDTKPVMYALGYVVPIQGGWALPPRGDVPYRSCPGPVRCINNQTRPEYGANPFESAVTYIRAFDDEVDPYTICFIAPHDAEAMQFHITTLGPDCSMRRQLFLDQGRPGQNSDFGKDVTELNDGKFHSLDGWGIIPGKLSYLKFQWAAGFVSATIIFEKTQE